MSSRKSKTKNTIAAMSLQEVTNKQIHHKVKEQLELIRVDVYNAVTFLQEAQWQTLTNRELQYIKFVLKFLQALECTATHSRVEDRTRPSWGLKYAEVYVKTEFYLTRPNQNLDENSTFNTSILTIRSQMIVNQIEAMLDQFKSYKPGPPLSKTDMEDMHKVLDARCAVMHFHHEEGQRHYANKFVNLMELIVKCQPFVKC